MASATSGSTTPQIGVSKQSSFASQDIKTVVKDYIEEIRKDAGTPVEEGLEDAAISSPESPLRHVAATASYSKRHVHLPPVPELEAYILESSSDGVDNLLNVLPDIAEAIASYVKDYPDQLHFVWESLKPILLDMRKRNSLKGKHRPVVTAPICPKQPYAWVNVHGDEIQDDYAWLTNKDDPEVLKYLEAENQFAELSLAHTKTLQKVLYKEFVSRLDENEESARVQLADGWSYFSRKIPNAEYRLHCRTDKNGFEEVYLDENELSQNPDICDGNFFHVGFLRHTPDCSLIAFGIDTTGNERYTTYFQNMETKSLLDDQIPDCYEDFEFSNDGIYAFYIVIDEYERAFQLYRHVIGTDIEKDVLLYEEVDEMFFMTMTKSCNKRYLIFNTSAQVTSETRVIPLDSPLATPRIVFPRREKIQYVVEHHGYSNAELGSQDHRGYFYVMTNEESKNNVLYRIPVPQEKVWLEDFKDGFTEDFIEKYREPVVEARDFVLIEAFQVRIRHLIVFERSNCMQNIRIVNLDPGAGFETFHYVTFTDGLVYSIWPGSVDEEVADLSKSVLFDTNVLRFTYTSFAQPKQVIDYNMDTKERVVVHEGRVLGPAYDPSAYVSKRLWTTGIDGTAVPMSIVYRKDLKSPDGNPLLLHGYGAYGYCLNPIFSTTRISLLDRGFIYAIAHVRGGGEMGNGWYIEGKLQKKINTFMDFISCAEYLIKEGYTTSEKLAIYGRSAGGLLIGATVNLRPDLFKAVLTEVPFVDAINTMFDSSIPWVAFEFEEWGNPIDKKIYDLMKSYCPYTNVISGQVYPNMLIVGGMNDPRVAYFEPAKWTAKLRALGKWTAKRKEETTESVNGDSVDAQSVYTNDPRLQDGDRLLLLKIQDSGHTGSGGQYSHLEDLAFEYAFLISVLGAQFRPVTSGGESLNGADYEKYWDELEHEADDYEGYEENLPRKPSTPLQMFSDFWKKRRGTRTKDKKAETKDKPSKAKSKRVHSRSSSLLNSGLGLILGRGKNPIETVPEIVTPEEASIETGNAESGTQNGEASSASTKQVSEAKEDAKEEDPVGELSVPKPLGPKRSPSTTPSGSKASLRLQLYPPEDESGRVQNSGKVYNFLSKFF